MTKARRYRYCVWEVATGLVELSAYGDVEQFLLTWNGEDATKRVRIDATAVPFVVPSNVEIIPGPIPDAGGSIDPATGGVTEGTQPSADEAAYRHIVEQYGWEDGRAYIARRMATMSRRYLWRLRGELGLFDETDTGLTPQRVKDKFTGRRADLTAEVSSAQNAASKFDLRTTWDRFLLKVGAR